MLSLVMKCSRGDTGCLTLSQSLRMLWSSLSLEELLRPIGGPSTGPCHLQFIVPMAYMTLAVGKELRPCCPGFSCLCVLLVKRTALGRVSKLVKVPAYEQGCLCELELST